MILIVNNKEMHRITALDLSKANYISITKSNELRINFSLDEPDIAVKLPELTEKQKGTLLGIISKVKNDENVVFELNDLLKFVQKEVEEDEEIAEAKA